MQGKLGVDERIEGDGEGKKTMKEEKKSKASDGI